MKMMNKIFYVLLAFAGVMVCLLMTYRNSVQQDLLIAKDITIDNLTNANVTLMPLFEACVMNCGENLDNSKIVLKDTSGHIVALKDFIKGSSALIYRYSDRYCKECVDYAFHILNHSKCDKQSVIYIGDCGKRKIFKKQVEESGLQGIALDCRSLEIPAEKMMFPYFLVIDSTLTIRCIYIPNKASHYQNIDSINFDLMYQRFVFKDLTIDDLIHRIYWANIENHELL